MCNVLLPAVLLSRLLQPSASATRLSRSYPQGATPMQAIVTPQLRWTALLSLTGYFLPASSLGLSRSSATLFLRRKSPSTTSPERYGWSLGPAGDVIVQVTRGGADAAKVKVLRGQRDGTADTAVHLPGEPDPVRQDVGLDLRPSFGSGTTAPSAATRRTATTASAKGSRSPSRHGAAVSMPMPTFEWPCRREGRWRFTWRPAR